MPLASGCVRPLRHPQLIEITRFAVVQPQYAAKPAAAISQPVGFRAQAGIRGRMSLAGDKRIC